MTDPMDRDKFPNRPDHPDFWRMSEVLLRIDGATSEGGESAPDVLGVDMDSFMYVASERIRRAVDIGGGQLPATVLYMVFMDAFALGKGFAEAGGHRE
jgi:hypothetical protein